jgi:hypothetical protein
MGDCTLKHGDSYHPKCEVYMIYKIGIGASKDLDFNTRNGDLTVRNRD